MSILGWMACAVPTETGLTPTPAQLTWVEQDGQTGLRVAYSGNQGLLSLEGPMAASVDLDGSGPVEVADLQPGIYTVSIDDGPTLRQLVGMNRLLTRGSVSVFHVFNLSGEGNRVVALQKNPDGMAAVLLAIDDWDAPVEVSRLELDDRSRAVCFTQGHLYVANESPEGGSVQIVDWSNDEPRTVGSLPVAAHFVTAQEGRLYVASINPRGVLVYDLANPADPVEIARWDLAAQPPAAMHEVFVGDEHVYATWLEGLTVLSHDLDPVDESVWPGGSLHTVTADADHVVTSDEQVGGQVRLWSPDLEHHRAVRPVEVNGIHALVFREDALILNAYADGVEAWALEDPPIQVGHALGAAPIDNQLVGSSIVYGGVGPLVAADTEVGVQLLEYWPRRVHAE